MSKPRGTSHTTLTETAELVVRALRRQNGVKMIAPGIIDGRRSGKRHITAVYTTAGMELIISGSGVQKVAVHTIHSTDAPILYALLKNEKGLQGFQFNERKRIL